MIDRKPFRPRSDAAPHERLAAAPISWGVCEVPGWGPQLHPRVGTLIETADDVERVLVGCEALLCLDTGHLRIGGVDTVTLASEMLSRVGHVHLKDVRDDVAEGLRAGRVDLREATRLGVFVPLGEGDARVEDVILALEEGGYPGWYVLEQDTIADRGAESPTRDARRSVEFVRGLDAGPGFAGRGAGREVTGSKP